MESNLIKFLTFSATMSAWVYIPILAKNLGLTDMEIGFIVAAYSSALFLSSFIFGRASDKYGRRSFLLLGLVLSAFAFFLLIFSQNFLTLFSIRFLVGFCVGIYPSSLIAYVHENKKD